MHPNNVGRCGHICNASYAVNSKCRGLHIGEKLVTDCLLQAKELGFKILQFNAVVESNVHARHLYERVGFKQLGTIPHGFRTEIRRIMQQSYFVIPDKKAAVEGFERIKEIKSDLTTGNYLINPDYIEAKSLATVAYLILKEVI